jgi:transglutaminase-like putative cysteine protease
MMNQRSGDVMAKLSRPWSQLALTLIVMSLLASAHAADVPDWLQAQTTVSLPTYDEKTNAVVLYDEHVVTVAPSGMIKHLQRRALRILRPDGEQWGELRVHFDNQTRITNLRAWAIPAQGKPYVVKEKQSIETALFGVENGELVSDLRTRVLHIPAAVPGSVIGYEVEQEEYPYLLLSEWDFQDTVPVRATRYTLNLPPEWHYQASWLNHTASDVVNTAPGQWQWSLHDLPAVKIEPAMPPWKKIAGRLSISLLKPGADASKALSWSDLGVWHTNLLKGRLEANAEMRQKVAELTANKTATLDKIKALARFVQTDIRYVAIELGIGGYQPHPATEVFAHRYGDCKDKVTLLASLLREIGINSYHVVINTERGSINAQTAPNLGFNHVVIAIALPDNVEDASLIAVARHPTLGRLLYFDPTSEYTPLGRLDGPLQANYGLLTAGNSGELLALPEQPAASSYVRRTAQLKLSPQGDLSGDLQDTRAGDGAARARYHLRQATQESERIEPIERLLADSLSKFKLSNATALQWDAIEQPFEWRYSVEAPGYAKASGDLIMLRPWVLGTQAGGFLETREARQNAIEFTGPSLDSDSFDILLPDGYDVEELPPPTQLDIGYMLYQSEVQLKGRRLQYRRTVEVKKFNVPAADADKLKNFYRSVMADERRMVVLKQSRH